MDYMTRVELLDAMAHHEREARKLYAAGRVEDGHTSARRYHEVADLLLSETGVEYRPED